MAAGTLSLSGIVEAWRPWWLIWQAPAMVIFFIAGLAEIRRPPFDMPLAESELVFGYLTEYTGLKFALFLLAEYVGIVVVAALTTVLFLGGWKGPFLDDQLGPLWTLVKVFTLSFVIIWIRATYPRLRADQLQRLAWLILVPAALAQLVRDRRGQTGDLMKSVPGGGLPRGLAITLRTMTKKSHTRQYPDAKPNLPPRSAESSRCSRRTARCDVFARECPDWCIYIDSHKESFEVRARPGPVERNVLDRFAIDFALCMYCGICIEVCPFDALFWSPEFEYSEYDIHELTRRDGPGSVSGCGPCRRRQPTTRGGSQLKR